MHLGEVAERLAKLATVVNLDVGDTQRTLYRRICYALCTGNGDLHLENLALLGDPKRVSLAPVYDPAPMRAWPRHDLRSPIPIDFDESIGGFGENLLALGRAFGQGPAQSRRCLDEALRATQDYPDRVWALEGVPEARRQRLAGLVKGEHDLLRRALARWD